VPPPSEEEEALPLWEEEEALPPWEEEEALLPWQGGLVLQEQAQRLRKDLRRNRRLWACKN
jgi:hypothetical protein